MTSQTVAHQAPLSMEPSRQEYWSGLPFPSSGDLPDPGIEPRSASQADSLPSEPPEIVIRQVMHSLGLPAQETWGKHFSLLNLNFVICTMGILIPALKGC